MTRRIYYTDPSCRTFTATVTAALEHDGRPAVLLEATAFYPTSGGQPFDRGQLGDAAVIDVIDRDGDVLHVLSGTLAPGTRVRGDIDWARRFDHMQQHTGQHVLSAAFDRLFENRTVSFHLGEDVSTIDLARELAPGEVDAATDEANRIVWEDRAVAIRFVSDAEARSLPLRKEPARQGTLRLIEVADFDLSACGGTHVARTGAIGVIAVTAVERLRGGSRVSFVCGGRAQRMWRIYRDAVAGSVRVLSVLPPDLPSAVQRVHAESRELQKAIGRLQGELAVHEAERLFRSAAGDAQRVLVTQVIDRFDVPGLKKIASILSGHGRVAAVLVSPTTPASVVVARSPDRSDVDAGEVLRRLLERFGGRGGGKPELAQGGGLEGEPAAIVAAARELLAG